MRLPQFECLEPKSIQEVCLLLARYKDKVRILAGGTDILVKMKNGELKPEYLIRLKNVSSLDFIEYNDAEDLRIGTLVKLSDLESSPLIAGKFSILAQAIQYMGSPQIRNLATLGGNICNAAPSADTVPSLIVLGARLKLVGGGGDRIVPLEEFFAGPEKTILGEGEMLEEIQVPNPLPNSGGIYLKHTIRGAMDLAILGTAVMISLDSNTCRDIKISLGAAAPTPIRCYEAENILKGKPVDDELINRVAQIAMEESRPRTSIRATSEYRRKMVQVLVRRALKQAWDSTKTNV